jgi:hypothetical protein
MNELGASFLKPMRGNNLLSRKVALTIEVKSPTHRLKRIQRSIHDQCCNATINAWLLFGRENDYFQKPSYSSHKEAVTNNRLSWRLER